jgi:hypothetical protein
MRVSLSFPKEYPMTIKSKGAAIASIAAVMALSMSAANAAKHMGAEKAMSNPAGSSGMTIKASDKVHCYGVTSCKGMNDCKTAENACKGQSACQGHGFKEITAKECLGTKGGAIADLKPKA